jgi:hypothetical protein
MSAIKQAAEHVELPWQSWAFSAACAVAGSRPATKLAIEVR